MSYEEFAAEEDQDQRALEESQIDMKQNKWDFDDDGVSAEITNEYDESMLESREARVEFTQNTLEVTSNTLEAAGQLAEAAGAGDLAEGASELADLTSKAADNPYVVEKLTDFGENIGQTALEMQGGGSYANISDEIEANKEYNIGDGIDESRVMVDESGESYVELTDDELTALELDVPEEVSEPDNYEFNFTATQETHADEAGEIGEQSYEPATEAEELIENETQVDGDLSDIDDPQTAMDAGELSGEAVADSEPQIDGDLSDIDDPDTTAPDNNESADSSAIDNVPPVERGVEDGSEQERKPPEPPPEPPESNVR